MTKGVRACVSSRVFTSSLFLCIIVLFLSSLPSVQIYSQAKKKITGIVRDDKGAPAPNVSVTVKGTSNGVTTNADGVYSIDVTDPNSTLQVSFVGFESQELPLNGRSSLDVALVAGNAQLDAVVVVGYGTQKKITVTGAVASVKGSELAKSPTVNLSNSLVGRSTLR